jgi:hypothetical protein
MAVKLEATGMKHSSGKSMRKHAALMLGYRANASHDTVIGALVREMDKLLKQKQAEVQGE